MEKEVDESKSISVTNKDDISGGKNDFYDGLNADKASLFLRKGEQFSFRLNNFDLLRLFAAFQVLMGHSLDYFGFSRIPLSVYLPGVPIFFVISGFLISASWERSPSLSQYIKNRVLRIYPALWFCLFLSLFVASLTYTFEVFNVEFFTWLVAQLTIGQFYNPEFFKGYGAGGLNGSLWTIPIELQFYLLIPIIYVIMRKCNWSNIILFSFVILFSVINYLRYYFQPVLGDILIFKLFSVTIIPYLNMFLFGVVLQKNMWFVERFLANKVLHWLMVYLVIVFATGYFGITNQGNAINPISAFFLSLLVISAAYSYVNKFGNVLKGNDISYGIYIYHMIAINFLLSINMFTPATNVVITILSVTVVAILSWKYLEQPMLSLKSDKMKWFKSSRV
ncbi:acyltransferase [Vibrio sp. SM6]|uniref:Acyltransferase n=1 Tax=Vibrio agarilyticus TaxID=2726741 RepID=A0A7X8YG12_9VIBR|nr:acyltransferase [Vibrio agarilyticus]NLS12473.1 acyltransferase [Vibrio agarilyticus]